MIVDSHMHIFPGFLGTPDGHGPVSLNYGRIRSGDKIVQQLPPSFERSSSAPELALAYMDYYGIDRGLLTQGPFYGFLNDYIAQAVYRWPDRFSGVACYNPTLGKHGPDELERWMTESGLVGIKCEAPSTKRLWPRFNLTGDTEMRVWERCARLGGILMLHLPDGAGVVSDVTKIVESFSGLRVLLCHLGNAPAEGWQEQVRMARHERVFMDIAGVWFGYSKESDGVEAEDYPYPKATAELEWAVQEIGAEKLLWGTDYPSTLRDNTYGQCVRFVKKAVLTDEQKALILGGTAERLLGLSSSATR